MRKTFVKPYIKKNEKEWLWAADHNEAEEDNAALAMAECWLRIKLKVERRYVEGITESKPKRWVGKDDIDHMVSNTLRKVNHAEIWD